MKKLIAFVLALCLMAGCALGETVRYVNNKNGLIVREEPDFNAKIAGYIPYKENVELLEDAGNGFLKVTYGKITGYVWAYYLTEENISSVGDIEMYVTSWAGLYLHEEADIESDTLTGVPFGTKVIVKEIGEVFSRCYVTVDDVEYKGYLWTGYLSKDVPDAAHAKQHHDDIVGHFGGDDPANPGSEEWGDWDWSW